MLSRVYQGQMGTFHDCDVSRPPPPPAAVSGSVALDVDYDFPDGHWLIDNRKNSPPVTSRIGRFLLWHLSVLKGSRLWNAPRTAPPRAGGRSVKSGDICGLGAVLPVWRRPRNPQIFLTAKLGCSGSFAQFIGQHIFILLVAWQKGCKCNVCVSDTCLKWKLFV